MGGLQGAPLPREQAVCLQQNPHVHVHPKGRRRPRAPSAWGAGSCLPDTLAALFALSLWPQESGIDGGCGWRLHCLPLESSPHRSHWGWFPALTLSLGPAPFHQGAGAPLLFWRSLEQGVGGGREEQAAPGRARPGLESQRHTQGPDGTGEAAGDPHAAPGGQVTGQQREQTPLNRQAQHLSQPSACKRQT